MSPWPWMTLVEFGSLSVITDIVRAYCPQKGGEHEVKKIEVVFRAPPPGALKVCFRSKFVFVVGSNGVGCLILV